MSSQPYAYSARSVAAWARHGLMHGPRRPQNRLDDPVLWADAACSTNDWRIALCLALGVEPRYIHPGTGHNLTPPVPSLPIFDGAA